MKGLRKHCSHKCDSAAQSREMTGAKAIVRGSLALYGMDQADQARKLLTLISSEENFTKGLNEVVRTHFNDPNWQANRKEK